MCRCIGAFVPVVALPPIRAGCGGEDDSGGCGTDDARGFRLSFLADGTVSGIVRDPGASDAFGGTVTAPLST